MQRGSLFMNRVKPGESSFSGETKRTCNAHTVREAGSRAKLSAKADTDLDAVGAEISHDLGHLLVTLSRVPEGACTGTSGAANESAGLGKAGNPSALPLRAGGRRMRWSCMSEMSGLTTRVRPGNT
jgi:hypothetical protein